ncbi:MAG: multicopper oxidase family protein [Acidimicrobiia bacterium]|nr:multicopper oxidase family protein [Acidimicrobiia bacterium]
MSILRARCALLPILWVAVLSGEQPAVTAACAALDPRVSGDADLYCIDLLPPLDIEKGAGRAELLPPATPFGLAVTPAGEPQHDVRLTLRDLPPPATLGAFTAYVAWVTTPQMFPVQRLGEVGNGQFTFGRVHFDRFIVLVTAEPAATAATQRGRVVLRGTSASMRMQPHDVAFTLAGMLDGGGDAAHADHADHAAHGADPGGWTPPPMYPEVAMPPAMMRLRPDVSSYLPADAADAPLARPRQILRLKDGEALTLTAAPVRRQIAGRSVTMLGFNGQYPGPLLDVTEQSSVTVTFVNHTDFPTAIHWHGLRLDNRFDGAPHVTQDPVPPGGRFVYTVHFPDAGLYWYHPHHREDALQDLGLYGNLLVRSREPDFFGPAHREEALMLDDLLVAGDRLVGYGRESPTHALMGRFGNHLMVNGEPGWQTRARRGEVVRLLLTNVSSTRVFNLSFERAGRPGRSGVRMKVVASDLGRYPREAWIDNITIAPAERFIVDARFEQAGDVVLVNRVRGIDHIQARFFEERREVGRVTVERRAAAPDLGAAYATLREPPGVAAEMEAMRRHLSRPVDHELLVTLQAGNLPFPLRPMMAFESVYRNPVEWTGTMPEMDWVVTGRQAQWLLRDTATGRTNMDIAWRFRVGDVVKLRFVNDRASLHAMHHPMHIHGQRFLVVSTNGVPNPHLVWKDTVLLPAGFTTEVLMEVTNPGKWMLHCHVAEHIETGMRMVFEVTP